MKYSQEFLDLAYKALHWCKLEEYIKLIRAIEEERHNTVRHILEDLLDDEELYVTNEIIDDGDRLISNSKIYAYRERKQLYNMFMDSYIEYLDGKKETIKQTIGG